MIATLILSFFYDFIKLGLEALAETHPIQKTILRIEEKYKDIENLRKTLDSWLTNENAKNEVDELIEGKREICIHDLAKTLVKDGGFYFGKETDSKSIEIIESFFVFLNEEYLLSDKGPLYHDRKEEERHGILEEYAKKNQEGIKNIQMQMGLETKSITGIPIVDKWKDKYKLHYTNRIDEAKEFLMDGKVKTAKKLYEKLIKDLDNEDSLPKKLTFRAATNLGCCELELGNNKAAAENFERAHKIIPINPIGLANMAIAKQLRGDISGSVLFLDKLLNKKPKDILGICIKSNILADEEKFKEALELFREQEGAGFDDELLEDAQCNFALGYVFYEKKNYLSAQKYFSQACKKNPKNSDYYLFLGLSFCLSLLRKKEFPWLLTEKAITRLKIADDNFCKAYDILKDQERDKKLETVLMNRSAVRIALENYDGAIEDCKAILVINPKFFTAIKNKAIAEGLNGQFDKAIESLKLALEDKTSHPEVISMIVYACLNKIPPDPEMAIIFINKYFPQEKINKSNLNIKIDLAESFIKKDDLKRAYELIGEIRDKFPENKNLFFLLFKYYNRESNIQEAEKNIKIAFRKAKGLERKIIGLVIANFYLRNNLYDKAIPFYEEVVNPKINNIVLKNYLICLYNSNNKYVTHPKIFEICKGIREKIGITEFITEIEAAVLETTFNKMKEARALYIELALKYPENVKYELRHAKTEFRLGNEEASLKIINQIKDKIDGDAEDLMTIAEILDFTGNKLDAIIIGYKALRLSPHDPKINMAYVHLFVARGKVGESELLNPKKISKDTAVKVKIDGSEKEVLIFETRENVRSNNEVEIESELAKNLLDLKVGDKISIGDSKASKQIIEILEIKSIYVKAFQDCILNFNFLFPKEHGIKSIKVGENLENVLDLIDERAKRISDFTNLYMQQKITMGFLSNLIGITLFDVWAGLISSEDANLMNSSGNIDIQENKIEKYSKTEMVSIDLIGLFTLTHLNILHLLNKVFNCIYISQSSLDEITNEIGQKSLAKEKGFLTIGKQEDKYVKREVTPDEIDATVDFLTKIKKHIQENLDILGYDTPIVPDDIEIVKALGRPSYDTLKIAREQKIPLYSDDLFFRELAWNEHEIDGFNIQTFLGVCRNIGLITEEEHNKKIIELVISNYYLISIGANVLFFSAKNSCFSYFSPEFSKLLETIQNPRTDLSSAVVVLVNFLKSIYLEAIPEKDKRIYLDLALDSLTKKRGDIDKIVRIFRKEIEIKFKYMPLHLSKVFEYIRIWKKSKLVIGNVKFSM